MEHVRRSPEVMGGTTRSRFRALVPGGECGDTAWRLRAGCGSDQEWVGNQVGLGRTTLCVWYVKETP